jgi:ABC-type sugar transport system ATPase subunit
LPELIGVSDRVYVMRDQGLVAQIESGPELTQERGVAFMV